MMVQSRGVSGVLATQNMMRPICFASITKTNNEQLRTQLDQLHSEAHATQSKVNNTRLRLMRLSEAAEKLKRQAAISVNAGKENEARELLFQKRKVMQAMERSKSRIQLLDELSAKLNEAISLKESQLIGNIAADHELDAGDDSGPVRVVAPTPEFQCATDSQTTSSPNKEFDSLSMQSCIVGNNGKIRSAEGISSYYDFLEHLDLNFSGIESKLVAFLNASSLLLNGEDPKTSKLHQLMELLESVQAVRQQIVQIMQLNMGIE